MAGWADRADAWLGRLLAASERVGPRELKGAAAAVAAALCAACVYRSAVGESDFDGFWLSARAILEGADFAPIAARYPPTFKVLMVPFAALPVWLAAALWTLLAYAALAATPRLLHRLGGPPPKAQALAWIAALPFIVGNVVLGQSAPALLFLVAWGLALARERRAFAGGAALALAAMVKVIPAAFVAAPALLRRARGSLGGLAAGLALGVALTAGALGWGRAAEGARAWRAELGRQTPRALLSAGRSLRYNNQALWASLLRTWTDAGEGRAKGAVRLAALPRPAVWAAYCGTLAAMGGAGLACGLRCRSREGAQDWLGLFALLAIGMLAVSPIVWTHYFYWLLPALVFLSARPALLVAIALLSTLALASASLRALGFHMGLALLLYALVALRLWRDPSPRRAPPDATL